MQKETSDKEIAGLSMYMKGSLRWRIAYFKVKFILVLESLVWTIMDALRAWRMKNTARINANYRQSLQANQNQDEEIDNDAGTSSIREDNKS